MEKTEAEKIGEALCRWLGNQGVSAADGSQAMAMALGAMFGRRSHSVVHLLEGLMNIKAMIEIEAFECLHNKLGKLPLEEE